MLPALILFLAYVVLALGHLPGLRLDRTGAAVIGAILMVTVGGLSFDAAVAAVNYRTLVLLFGMMVLVAHLQLAGFFGLVARSIAGRITHPVALVGVIAAASGALSALFVNDPVCLVLTPVVIEVTRLRRLNPLPVLLALATGSNIGSVKLMPVNLMLQFHFLRESVFRPYIGAGGNYTRFYEVNFAGGTEDVDRDRFGPVAQVGFDIALGKSLLLNADVKKIWLQTDANGLASGTIKLDPWVYALGIGFRF